MVGSTNGQPRYSVCRLSRRRWPLPRYGVMCGDGTGPVFTTWRYHLALLVRQLLEGACNDGGFIVQQRQLPDGMSHCRIRFVECPRGHGRLTADNWVQHGCHWCRIARLRRGLEGIASPINTEPGNLHGSVLQGMARTALDETPSDGEGYSKSFVLQLLGYLTGAIPELHKFECGRMVEILEEFERKHQEPKL